ncbi:MAG: tetratricopeptide repeat protein [Elusimicrobia bacterium]|nr:tetratricopeptide repeat protein [Elusimicrobiota bacterium]
MKQDPPPRPSPTRGEGESSPATREGESGRWTGFFCALGVAAVTAFVFWPALANGFVWDDQALLVGNQGFRGFGPRQWAWMFAAPRFAQYHPLTWLTFAADWRLYGMDPRGFHLTSVLLHAANAALLFLLADRLLALGVAAEAPERRRKAAWGAAFAALAFALSPLRVESVAWLTERRGLLASSFLLASTLAYVRGCREDPGRCAAPWLVLSLNCFAFALLSKAVAVTLPGVLLLIDFYPLRRPLSSRRVWLEKLPYLALALPFALLAPLAQARGGAMEPLSAYGLAARSGQAVYGVGFYLRKALVPWPLLPLYRFPDASLALGLQTAAAGLVAAAITLAAASSWKRRPALLAAWGSFLVLLVPLLGFFQSGPHYVAERYTYLPCMGLSVLAGAAVASAGRKSRPGVVVLAAVYLAGLAALTRRQVPVWRDPVALWTHVVGADPRSHLAQNNLCAALRDARRPEEAVGHCQAALRLAPAYAGAHCNMANLLSDQDRLADAVAEYRVALRLDPDDPVAHNGLGHVLYRKRLLPPARAEFEQALSEDPDYALAHANLGAVLSDQGLASDAKREFDAAIALAPGDAGAHFDLGNLHLAARRLDDAAREYREAIRLDAGHARARVNLGLILAGQGRLDEAAAEYRAALLQRPDFADVYNNLGIVLFRQGRRREAIESFERAVALNPSYADAKFNLERARRLSR